MPVSFRILPEYFLVYVRYTGCLRIADSSRAFAACIALPAYRKGMRELIDLTEVTGWEPDYPGIMKHAALEAEFHAGAQQPTMVVSLAPSAHTRSMARIITRAWERSGRVVPVTVETEAEALSVLGVDVPSIDALLQTA